MVQITLPDGSQRQYPGPVTVADVAQSIGTGLAKAARAAAWRSTAPSQAGRHQLPHRVRCEPGHRHRQDADGLDLIRHSTAHLLAYAVKSLFPDAQVTIGPVIDNGFYYDFSYKRPFTPEDLAAIEKKMAELAKKDEVVTREEWSRDDAVEFFKGIGESTRPRSSPRSRPTRR